MNLKKMKQTIENALVIGTLLYIAWLIISGFMV